MIHTRLGVLEQQLERQHQAAWERWSAAFSQAFTSGEIDMLCDSDLDMQRQRRRSGRPLTTEEADVVARYCVWRDDPAIRAWDQRLFWLEFALQIGTIERQQP